MIHLKIWLLLTVVGTISAVEPLNKFNWTQITSPLKEFAPKSNSLIEGKIVGGYLASVNQFPYQAAIVIEYTYGQFFCGGSIISENIILTAAHCLFDGPNGAYVFVGLLSIENLTTAMGVLVDQSGIVVHEGYDNVYFKNDIAFIRLPSAVPTQANIQIISLPSRNQVDNLVVGEAAIASGWGRDSDNATSVSLNLRFVFLPITSNTVCQNYFGDFVTSTHICVSGAGGKGTCSGDSGGPLTVIRNGITILVGITSFGSSLGCEIGYPPVFTRVGSYLDWLQANANIVVRNSSTRASISFGASFFILLSMLLSILV